ncbi:rRNA-processing protein fcf2 [Nicotiana tabacum]|uniref:rRNA-processing protein fcf2 n=4 Tax=Nicotiana TaxID=4085 RepID=A0A1S3ZEX1_TOBAC|nr:PREDICTED: rRNA-processing protein fcf2-like [Nicotiana sylvestris]XP_009794702.1 PREDICTED: rRNA-processing protein fcf2-like [Nicotiana sylvestris]XP_016462899.1 PREDICTED: rRNA-processing protein fcf2-like [Nicotiana tabacum]
MPENKPVIGLSWEPKLPQLSFGTKKSSSNKEAETSAVYKPSSELIDGLFVPPNDPKKVNKFLRKQVKDTAGKNWFDMPAQTITPELKRDLQLLKLRGAMDPKRHYKKSDLKSKALPKYFQVGTVIEPASEYYSSRLTKKERKTTITDELLSDRKLGLYRKRKVREIEEHNRPGGVDKWKIRGSQSWKRAKQRRH